MPLEDFFAISIYSCLGKIINTGEILIEFFKFKKVGKQKKKLFQAAQASKFHIFSGELIPSILKPFFKMTFTALINLILAIVKSLSSEITLQWL